MNWLSELTKYKFAFAPSPGPPMETDLSQDPGFHLNKLLLASNTHFEEKLGDAGFNKAVGS